MHGNAMTNTVEHTHMKTTMVNTHSCWHTSRELWDSLQQKLQSHDLHSLDCREINILCHTHTELKECIYITEPEITVRHWTISDHFS